MEELYGKKRIYRWLKIGTPQFPLDIQDLERRDIFDSGICMGMSLEFCAKYIKWREKEISPLKAVKYASYRYKKGSTKTADLLQIFGKALHTKGNIYKKVSILAQKIWR